MNTKLIAGIFTFFTAMIGIAKAEGQLIEGQPYDWQYRFQKPATGIMEQIERFEVYTLWFIIPITLLVLGLLVYVMVRFSAKSNPVPSRTSHNTMIEVIWTLGPVFVLLLIAFPSFNLLTAQYSPPPADITIKATGNQWYWSYEYQSDAEDEVSFDSILLADDERDEYGKGDVATYPRLLAVDHDMVVPVGKTVLILVTASDVLHSFALPSFGLKMDAVPGRLNETWFIADREGIYYGQCSELCGKDHAYMPIAIRVVSEDQYENWHAEASSDLESANKQLMAAIETDRKSVDVATNNAK